MPKITIAIEDENDIRHVFEKLQKAFSEISEDSGVTVESVMKSLDFFDKKYTEIRYDSLHNSAEIARINRTTLGIPEYIICETEADNPVKECIVKLHSSAERPAYIIDFSQGNDLPKGVKPTLRLLYDDNHGAANLYVEREIEELPEQFYPHLHAMFYTHAEYKQPIVLEFVAITSIGIPNQNCY